MTPHKQVDFGEGTGDCFATCIASILDMPLESVPNFRRLQSENDRLCMITEADKWLRQQGKRFISIEMYEPRGGHNTSQVLMNRLFFSNPDDYVILSGESPRKNADGSKKYHCVVGRADCWGFEMIHDPHPDNTFLVGQPYGVKWIVGV